MKTRKTILILLTTLVTTKGDKCRTDDNKDCIFPFRHQNQTYAGCTANHDQAGELWCSTGVNSDGEHVAGVGAWGHCQGDCPTAEERREAVCGVVEVEDDNKEISGGIYLVDKGNYHHGRPIYKNTKNNLEIFWLNDVSGWGLGNLSGEVVYTSGPGVSNDPLLGVWLESQLKISCAEDTIFTRSSTSSITRSSTSISQNTRTCEENESCLTRENCPEVDDIYRKKVDGRVSKDPVLKEGIGILKKKVCNKEKKGFCCSTTKDICKKDAFCRSVDECPDVKEKIKLIKSGGLSFRESIKIYNSLKLRICDNDSKKFCCQEDIKQTETETMTSVSSTTPGQDTSSVGTFLPRSSERTCGLEAQQTSHFIINGNKTKPGQFPFMALLGRKVRKDIRGNGKSQVVPEWVCGGSLINHWYVLTAAHCQDPDPRFPLAYVRIGDWDISTDDCIQDFCLPEPQTFEIKGENFLPHEEFIQTKGNVHNDIALIRLPRPAQRNAGVQFVCLPLSLPERSLGVADETGEVIGWGYTKSIDAILMSGGDREAHNIPVVTQQSATLPIISREECDDRWSLTGGLQPGQMCAGGVNADSCRGDSGGPLLMRMPSNDNSSMVSPWIVSGVVSFGSRYCASGRPGVYTRVAEYVDWIQEHIET